MHISCFRCDYLNCCNTRQPCACASHDYGPNIAEHITYILYYTRMPTPYCRHAAVCWDRKRPDRTNRTGLPHGPAAGSVTPPLVPRKTPPIVCRVCMYVCIECVCVCVDSLARCVCESETGSCVAGHCSFITLDIRTDPCERRVAY